MPARRGHGFDSRREQRRKVAKQHIQQLMDSALAKNVKNPEQAERHASLAWKLSTRFNVRLREKRLFFCHKCKKFIVPPRTARIRLSRKRRSLNITCLKCQSTYRRIF